MKYIGIKPFREFSSESLPISATGLERHGIFYEYETIPTPRIRYIYIEQPNLNLIHPGWYHLFEVNLNVETSNPEDLDDIVKNFASMIDNRSSPVKKSVVLNNISATPLL